MTAQVTIITPTYSKPEYFAQCAESVLAQTYQEWVWWVVINSMGWPEGYDSESPIWEDPRVFVGWFGVSEDYRKSFHVPSKIVNQFYSKVQTPYIYFLADDDLIDRDGLGVLVKNIGFRDDGDDLIGPWYDAVYGRCEVQNEQPDGSFTTSCWCYDGQDVGLNTSIDPDCRLDGGQVLHTKALWDRCTADGWQLSDKKEDAGHNDGQLLSRLAQFATFHYVPQRICTHRRTHLSSFHKPQL